jgi:hypothetical protein
MQQDIITSNSLDALNNALQRFHHHHKIFQETGVHPTRFSFPHQHSLTHCHYYIEEFGALNRLSLEITKLKHISAIKKLWRQSNCCEALGQMLTTNTQNSKLITAWINSSLHGMLDSTCLSKALERLEAALKDTSDNEDNKSNDNDSEDDDSEDNNSEDDNSEDNDSEDGQDPDTNDNEDRTGPVDRPPTLSEVTLAQKQGKHQLALYPNAIPEYQCSTWIPSDIALGT